MKDTAAILRQTLKEMRRNETFEKALGRVIRKNGGTYQDYIELVSAVRDRAHKKGRDLLEAAKELSES